jgi:MarR family transcriptional regulator, organic hydroperoxide resistance regulator
MRPIPGPAEGPTPTPEPLPSRPPGPPVPAAQRAGIERLRHAVHVFIASERRLRGRYQRSGESLSHAHLRALFVLTTEPEVTAGRLAREAELNSASVTAMVDQLEARGLVQRRRDGQDRRAIWISLTDLGRSEVAEQEARWRRQLAEAFAGTSDAELEAAGRVLERLAAVFDTQPIEERSSA